MDSSHDRQAEDAQDEPSQHSEATVRAMLEQSRLDVADGRMVPAAPVLDGMRATAERIRRERAGKTGSDRRLG